MTNSYVKQLKEIQDLLDTLQERLVDEPSAQAVEEVADTLAELIVEMDEIIEYFRKVV